MAGANWLQDDAALLAALAAGIHAHAGILYSLAGGLVTGLHLPDLRGCYRRAAVALAPRVLRSLKGAIMTPQQTQTIVADLKAGAAFTVQLVEAMLVGGDGAAKRAKAIELIQQGLAAGESTLHVPALIIAITTNTILIGFLVDQAVAEANQLGLFGAAVVVPQIAPPTLLEGETAGELTEQGV